MQFRVYSILFLCLSFATAAYSQSIRSPQQIGEILLAEHTELVQKDVEHLKVDRQYISESGITYIYVSQIVADVPVYNAVASITISADGTQKYVSSKFISEANDYVKKSGRIMQPEKAVRRAFQYGGLSGNESLKLNATRTNGTDFVFTSEAITDHDARARLRYVFNNHELVLSWDISFFPVNGEDFWSFRLNASNGELIDRSSFTVKCSFGESSVHDHDKHNCEYASTPSESKESIISFGDDGAQYRVIPLPTESPLHGPRALLTSPSDDIASPFGWHDLNNVDGAETNVTEGNNVNAWLVRSGNFGAPDRDISGGQDLIFDFPYDNLSEPVDYQDAATTNLFYMVNMMHDFTYAYGFNEEAGNFQLNNFGRGGLGGDAVRALAQFNGNSSGNLNNADFSTPDDGSRGQMRMFLWNTRNDITVFEVVAPSDVAGIYASRTATFGETIDQDPLIAEVEIADDGMGIGSDACESIINDDDINEKIVIIDRGDCEFGAKVLNAEQNGAIGVIICNNESGLLSGQMGAGAVGNQVNIPSVFISQADCDRIRIHVGDGLEVKFQAPPEDDQPRRVDGSMDNGIIAHEFAHGISNRLTAGPTNTGCLGNPSIGSREEGEQMGEGWSDFFSLVVTVEPGDLGTDARGIGNYALRNPVDGSGIRSYPYSTDMTINPVTYYDTYNASVPHGVGQVWCSMLWDMYWLFVDRYGWSEDFIHGDKGNNKAIQLVMDGMKMQPCNPGFVDGRDAILSADLMINDGDNQDIIWEAFARRGLGQNASQGISDLVADGKEDYSIPAQFIKTMKLAKSMTSLINKGEQIAVTLEVRNDTEEDVLNIEILDIAPEGTDFNMASLPSSAVVSGDEVIFSISELSAGAKIELSYNLNTPDIPSRLILLDDFEDPGTDGSTWQAFSTQGSTTFDWVDDDANSGAHSWKLENMGNDVVQSVFSLFETAIDAEKPVLRFAHKFDTDAGNDGCIVEISTDFLVTTQDIGQYIFRNPYNNAIRRGSFPSSVESTFSGSTNGNWIESYIDLATFKDSTALFQFTFASDAVRRSNSWAIDDFTFFDALTYNSEACLSYEGGVEQICAEAKERGTIVEPEEFSSTIDFESNTEFLHVFPSPVSQMLNIEVKDLQGYGELAIRDARGRVVWNQSIQQLESASRNSIRVDLWSAGLYFVELLNDNNRFTTKFIKQ